MSEFQGKVKVIELWLIDELKSGRNLNQRMKVIEKSSLIGELV